ARAPPRARSPRRARPARSARHSLAAKGGAARRAARSRGRPALTAGARPPAGPPPRSPQPAGRAAGGWLVAAPRDQREDDADSLCFDAEPFRERTEMLGAPALRLVVSFHQAAAFVGWRLA